MDRRDFVYSGGWKEGWIGCEVLHTGGVRKGGGKRD